MQARGHFVIISGMRHCRLKRKVWAGCGSVVECVLSKCGTDFRPQYRNKGRKEEGRKEEGKEAGRERRKQASRHSLGLRCRVECLGPHVQAQESWPLSLPPNASSPSSSPHFGKSPSRRSDQEKRPREERVALRTQEERLRMQSTVRTEAPAHGPVQAAPATAAETSSDLH